MVKPVSIGVVGIQGAVSEHITMLWKVCKDLNLPARINVVRKKEFLKGLNGIILPGGESTTISKFLAEHQLTNEIYTRVTDGSLAIMGTCAGCVLLAKNIIDNEDDVLPLRLLDIEVKRNAFGRQRQSFEQNVIIEGFDEPFPAVFIRAPLITKIGESCRILAQINSHIVMVQQRNMLALSFHPELTADTRIHQYFIKQVKSLM